MEKNVAGKWIVFAYGLPDHATLAGEPVTGDAANITANIRIDGGAANAVDDTNPTELEDGYYIFDITATEANGDNLVICPASATANVQVIGVPGAVWTRPPNFNALTVSANGEASADVNFWEGSDLSAAGAFPKLGIVHSGTAQASSSTTVTLAAAFNAGSNDNIVGMWLSLLGTEKEAREITAFNNTTKVATVNPAFTSHTTGTPDYLLSPAPPASVSNPAGVNLLQINGATAPVNNLEDDYDGTGYNKSNSTLGTVTLVTTTTNLTNQGGYKKNTAGAAIPFVMVDETDHSTREAGLTITGTRSIDGAAFGAVTGTISEVANGVYIIDPSAADLNGDSIVFRFTATGADEVEIHVRTYE